MRERRQGWAGKSHRWILLTALCVLTLCLLVACKGDNKAAAPTGPVGKVTELRGSVTASGKELGQRALELGATVHADDEISTADGAAVTIHLDHNEANWSLGGGMKVVVSSSAAFRAKKGASGAFDEAGEGKTVAAGRHTERQAGEDPSTVVAATEAALEEEPKDSEAPGSVSADEVPMAKPAESEPVAIAPKAENKTSGGKSSSKRHQSSGSTRTRSMPKPSKQEDMGSILNAAPPPRQATRAAAAREETSNAEDEGADGDSPRPSAGGMSASGSGSGGGGPGPGPLKKASSKRSVAYDSSVSSGPLAKDVLQRALRNRQSAFVHCAAPMSEALVVTIGFEVDTEGVVRGAKILQSPHLKLGNCVLTKVRSIKFPSLKTASKVEVTLRFDPLN